jgi:hypothetical protein
VSRNITSQRLATATDQRTHIASIFVKTDTESDEVLETLRRIEAELKAQRLPA